MLTKQEEYLESGIHIGTRLKTPYMKRFIYKARPDKLYVMNLEEIDRRIEIVGKFLAKYDPSKIVVVASRVYAMEAAKKFCELVGCKLIERRFLPGTFTNPHSNNFMEPEVVLVSDPRTERQALKEATEVGIPTVALVDTDNSARFVDIVLPCNNKGRKALNLVYKLLAMVVLRELKVKDYQKKVEEMFKEEEEIKVKPKAAKKSKVRERPKGKKGSKEKE